jgi:hypothetical protein
MTVRIKNNNKKRFLLKFGVVLYLGFCLFAIIWLRASVVNLEYDIWLRASVVNLEYELGALDKMRAELIRERKMGVAQRASFYSTEKIENAAIKRLGMTLPERENVYFVKRTSAAAPFRASMK